MSKRAANLEKRGAVLDREGREAVAEIVQPNVWNARQNPHLVPGAVDALKRLIADRGREDVLPALI